MSNRSGLRILIFATAGAGWLVAGQQWLYGQPKPTADKTPEVEPRYEVPTGARDPFFLGTTAAEPVSLPAGPLTQSNVGQMIQLRGILEGRSGESTRAILNGNVYKEGDELIVRGGAKDIKLKVSSLQLSPPKVILTYGEQEFVITINSSSSREDRK